MERFFSMPRKSHPRVIFSKEEDEKLKKLVDKHGTNNWILIAKHMPKRNSRQVRERWFNYLRPDLNNTPWTKEEEELLLKKYAEIGNKWRLIATFFENRTDINIKSKFQKIQRKQAKQQQSMYITSSPEEERALTEDIKPKENPVPATEISLDIFSNDPLFDNIDVIFDEKTNYLCDNGFINWF